MGSRLKEIREARGLSVAELARRAGISKGQIYKFQRGDLDIGEKWREPLRVALEVSAADLLDSGPLSIPLRYRIGSTFSEGVEREALADPEMIKPPRGFAGSEHCFAVQLADDHADRLYPPETILVVRELDDLSPPLALGNKILVRHFLKTRADDQVMEHMVGTLDRTAEGDLVANILSHDRRHQRVMIQRHPLSRGLRDAAWPIPRALDRLDYRPRDDDEAEILGRIVLSIAPE